MEGLTVLVHSCVLSLQVTPDVRKDDGMDICDYVKFKKIPGGNKSDCEMISGVVFTKNIANKKMASVLSNPKILVLSCAIDYQVCNEANQIIVITEVTITITLITVITFI